MSTKTLSLSSKIPFFNLKGVDGKLYSPDTFADSNALIIIFSCNHCPYVQAYEGRIIEIQKKYKKEGVVVIAINANDDTAYPDDSFENMKVRAQERNFNFLYLRDEDQSAAKSFDATHTPEIFLFDGKKELVYHGKIDDNWQEPKRVVNHYLEDALNELFENKEISVPETYSIGCTIKWK